MSIVVILLFLGLALYEVATWRRKVIDEIPRWYQDDAICRRRIWWGQAQLAGLAISSASAGWLMAELIKAVVR